MEVQKTMVGSGSNSGNTQGILNRLNSVDQKLTNSFSKLSSGSRITKAADDAAGLAIASALEAEAVKLSVATRNASDGQSLAQIQEGALGQISGILTRVGELAAQASNGTLSNDQRVALEAERSALSQEAERIAATTEFNGVNVFSGGSTSIQVGTSSENGTIAVPSPDLSGILSTLSSSSIGTQGGAQALLDTISPQIAQVSATIGQIGSAVARLDVASENNRVGRENALAAASRIRDVDIADETAKNVAFRIQRDAATATLAQSNKLNAGIVQRLLQ